MAKRGKLPRLPKVTIRLQGKVFAIVASTLAGLGLIAGIYFQQSGQIAAATTRERDAAAYAQGLSDISYETEALLGATRDFVILPTKASQDAVNKRADTMRGQLGNYADEPELQAAKAKLPTAVRQVTGSIAALGLSEAEGYRGALNQSASAIDDAIGASAGIGPDLNDIKIHWLLLRQQEKDFRLTADVTFISNFYTTVSDLQGDLKRSTLTEAAQKNILQLLEAYNANMSSYSDGKMLADDARAELSDTVTNALTLITQRRRDAEAAGKTANAALLATRDALSGAILIAIGMGALLSVSLALLIGRSIERPITRLGKFMSELAAGHLDQTVPFVNRGDEIGEMARTVEVFRNNGLRVRVLTEEERAGAERRSVERAEMMKALQDAFGEVVDAAVNGNFAMRVRAEFPDPELNALAVSVNNLVETVDRGLSETGAVLAALAETDLTQRVEGQYEGAFARLKDDTNRVAGKLTEIVTQLRGTSRALKTATGELLAGANDLSSRTSMQASTIEETSATMGELATTVLDNAKRAEEASANAGAVTRTAEEGGLVMNRANEAMERITTSSKKISNIIGMIDDIAFQTNLLALNASVEAARAGESGKGFAVVAVEVRRLAQSAAEASSEVKKLIEQSANEVQGGSKLVSDASTKLSVMVEAARANNLLIDAIAKQSREQAISIDVVNKGVRQIDEITQQNAALVEETNSAIEQTEAQASELDQVVDVFHLADEAEPPATRRHNYRSLGNTALASDWEE